MAQGPCTGGGRGECGNGAVHDKKRKNGEAIQRWRGAMEHLGKTGEDADAKDRPVGVVPELG